MGGNTSKQIPEPVQGLEENAALSVIPIFRTSIRVSLTTEFDQILIIFSIRHLTT